MNDKDGGDMSLGTGRADEDEMTAWLGILGLRVPAERSVGLIEQFHDLRNAMAIVRRELSASAETPSAPAGGPSTLVRR